MTDQHAAPSPILFFETAQGFQRSAALKGAIDLGLFTAIGEGATTVDALAAKCEAAPRGIRILCDYLAIIGFLNKNGQAYELTPESAMFLDKRSQAYLGCAVDFLLDPMLLEHYRDVAATVRKGGTIVSAEGSVSPENPVWVKFARAMMPMMFMQAQAMAGMLGYAPDRELRVLDIAAGHGIFGIAVAQRYPNAQITALDWGSVLQVAQENAQKFGVADRHHILPGSAFDVEFGGPYDVILLTNFLHHFDAATNETLLRKVHAALADGGTVITLEFVPNDDRISPPAAAAFSMTMLNSTAQGDAYTFAELDSMLRKAGFSRNEMHRLEPTPQTAIISSK